MSIRILFFLIGFGLTVIGLVYIISYLNLLTVGYNFKEYVQFIIRRIECLNALIGFLIMLCTIYLPGGKMNYIYDILLNFDTNLYDFYDWNTTDDITHIRKVPVFKINNKTYRDIKYNKIKVEQNFVTKIKKRCETFEDRQIIDEVSLFSNGKEAIAIKFENGINKYKSLLLLDEEEEIIEACERMNYSLINYEVIEKSRGFLFETKKEYEKKIYLNEEINRLVLQKEEEKLKYIFFECFNKKEEDLSKIVEELNKNISNEKISNTLESLFKLISNV